MIDPKFQTASQLLKENFKFEVPRYQRPYAWREAQAAELIDDITEYIGKEPGLYLGTLILDESTKGDNRIQIVDGQQRLTTIFILLIACREHARALGEQSRINAIQKFISFTNDVDNKTNGMKLIASNAIRPLFELMASDDWDGKFPDKIGGQPAKRAVNKIGPVYSHFRNKLSTMTLEQLGKLQVSIYNIGLIRIDIDHQEEAFSIFERTNDRGMDLEVADLLKNYLHQENVTGIDKKWEDIRDNSSNAMLRMLKAFYVSRCGYVQKSDLYKNLRKYSEKIGGANSLAEQILAYSEYYAFVNTLNTNAERTKEYFRRSKFEAVSGHQDRFTEIHNALQALQFFGVSQTQPLIYAALLAISRLSKTGDDASAKALVRLLSALENFHFVNTSICSHIGNEVEKAYADFAARFGKTNNFVASSEEVINWLRKQEAPASEFESKFVQLRYSQKALGKIAYIFDRFNNYGRKAGERKTIFYPDKKVFKKHFNVEHILAQKGGKGEGTEVGKEIDNIGNLVVVTVSINSSLGNKTVEEKFKQLKGSLADRVAELPTVSQLVKKYEDRAREWNQSVISDRAGDLAKQAYTRVWKV